MKNTSIIIHFRKDCEDRIFNLKTILRYLNDIVKPHEVILINDDKSIDPIMKWVKETYPHIKLLFCENSDEFMKSHCFNQAASQASGKILCFYDVDVLVPIEQLQYSEDLILNNSFDHVYPFSGLFVDVKKCFFDKFLPWFDFITLKLQLTDTTLGFYNGNVNIISDNSPGGCNLISKKAFDKISGYDTRFIGWGFEDTDFVERSKKINNVQYLGGVSPIYHLEHTTHCDQDRSQQPHYSNNLKQYLHNLNA